MKNVELKPIIVGTLVAVASVIFSSILAVWALFEAVSKNQSNPDFMQIMMRQDHGLFPQKLRFEAGIAGILAFVTGYILGPFLIGLSSAYFAHSNKKLHVLIFAVAIPVLWFVSALFSLPADGFELMLGSIALSALMIFFGGNVVYRSDGQEDNKSLN